MRTVMAVRDDVRAYLDGAMDLDALIVRIDRDIDAWLATTITTEAAGLAQEVEGVICEHLHEHISAADMRRALSARCRRAMLNSRETTPVTVRAAWGGH